MAHSYTPGLTVSRHTHIVRLRELPNIRGVVCKILFKEGDQLEPETVIARADLPGPVSMLNLAFRFSASPQEVAKKYLCKQVGDVVKAGDVVAHSKPSWKILQQFTGLHTYVKSLVDGTVESFSLQTGTLVIRQQPRPIEVRAYIKGMMSGVVSIPHQAIVVETDGAFVQGIFGIGGETCGKIVMATPRPEDPLDVSSISSSDIEGALVVVGSHASKSAIEELIRLRARALVVGGVNDLDLQALLGKDLGVAITGEEHIGISIILTEGFGILPMATRTFELFGALEGKLASCTGVTQIRAGVHRPEIIVAGKSGSGGGEGQDASEGELVLGSVVRIIREPYFGKVAKVVGLPVELEQIETESKVRVLIAELADGNYVRVPRTNVERFIV